MRNLPAVAAEKRAQAAVARSILLRLMASDGLPRLDAADSCFARADAARAALASVADLLALLNADVARLDA